MQKVKNYSRYKKLTSKKFLYSFLFRVFLYVLLIGISFIILFPLIVKFSESIKSYADNLDPNVIFIPKNPTLSHYRLIMNAIDYPRALWTSIWFNLSNSILQVLSCSVVAYGFARFRFKGRNALFVFVMLTMLIPPQTIMLPLYIRFRYFGFTNLFHFTGNLSGIADFTNTMVPFFLLSITAMGFKNGLYIFMLRQYFKNIPASLEEAAYIDGCGKFRTFFQIVMPGATPMLITVLLFSFVWQWNDRFYTGTLHSEIETLANLMFSMKFQQLEGMGDFFLQNMLSNAKLILLISPLIIFYFFTQRYFKESIERSGLVG